MSGLQNDRHELCHRSKDHHHDKTEKKQMYPSGNIHLCIMKVRREKQQCRHRQGIKDHPKPEKRRDQL